MNTMHMWNENNEDFRCINCRNYISANPYLSGVNHRNHCPYCLHSRHLDLYKAGDRLAACKGLMKPVGLTVKRSRNKYARQGNGELMIVHRCQDCGKYSINRIAADDDSMLLKETYKNSISMDTLEKAILAREGIRLLQRDEQIMVATICV